MQQPRRVLLPVVLGCTALLALVSQVLHPSTVSMLFEEDGSFEVLSVVFWITTALAAVCSSRFNLLERLTLAIASLTLAVREAGLPPGLVPSGKQLISASHYLDAAVPLGRRLIEGGVILMVTVSMIGAAITVLRMLWRDKGWTSLAGQLMLWAGGLLVVAEICDGLHPVSESVRLLCLSFEEGFETISPLFVTLAIWAYSRFFADLPSLAVHRLRHH